MFNIKTNQTSLICYNDINPKNFQTVGNIVVYNILKCHIDNSQIHVRTNFCKARSWWTFSKNEFGGVL